MQTHSDLIQKEFAILDFLWRRSVARQNHNSPPRESSVIISQERALLAIVCSNLRLNSNINAFAKRMLMVI